MVAPLTGAVGAWAFAEGEGLALAVRRAHRGAAVSGLLAAAAHPTVVVVRRAGLARQQLELGARCGAVAALAGAVARDIIGSHVERRQIGPGDAFLVSETHARAQKSRQNSHSMSATIGSGVAPMALAMSSCAESERRISASAICGFGTFLSQQRTTSHQTHNLFSAPCRESWWWHAHCPSCSSPGSLALISL